MTGRFVGGAGASAVLCDDAVMSQLTVLRDDVVVRDGASCLLARPPLQRWGSITAATTFAHVSLTNGFSHCRSD